MKFKISVWVVTYNHEKYIGQCLDGILSQKTNFEIEIIIGEDHSTDKTREICEQYAKNNSNINLLPLEENLGLVKNWERTLNACHGKYVAMCEGDDFWIDPYKLQKQIDFMEQHTDCTITFHKVKLQIEDQVEKHELFTHLKAKEYSPEEVYNQWTVLTSSVVYRNIFERKIRFPRRIYITDIYFTLLLMETGKAYCLDFEGVAYRRHSTSVSLQKGIEQGQKLYRQYRYMYKRFPELKAISTRKINEYLDGLIYAPFFKGIWKYRFYKMRQEPRLLFSSFFTTTLTSYIIQRKR